MTGAIAVSTSVPSHPLPQELAPERQAELRAAYEANLAAGEAPYADIRLHTLAELEWVFAERGWSGDPIMEGKERPDLRGADLRGVELGGAFLRDADLSGALLDRCILSSADLTGALLDGASLGGADLSRARLNGADLRGANLRGATLRGAGMTSTDLRGADLSGASLGGADLHKADLRGAILNWANLSGATLVGAALSTASLVGAMLCDARLIGATLVNANLAQADLSRSLLSGANLSGADLRAATLNRARLIETDLSGADLTAAFLGAAFLDSANLSGARLDSTYLSGADLRLARMDAATQLRKITISSTTWLGDVVWNGASLTQVGWGQLPRVGDEQAITSAPDRRARIQAYHAAARAYRGLSAALRGQGLVAAASTYRLREQRLERRALRAEGRYASWLYSVLLDLATGYGERPGRIFGAYVAVVLAFAAAYLGINQAAESTAQLTWDQALLLSLMDFHGRGFFPASLGLGDWIARLGTVEAVIGVCMELALLAIFSKRFLG